MLKWQIGICFAAGTALMAVYAGAKEPTAGHYDAAYCAERLDDLRIYKTGISPKGAPLAESSTAIYVSDCAKQDKQFAQLAAPYL